MSMSAEVHDTILSFCLENNIPKEKAVALLREIVDDMNGDGDTYDFSFVSTEYSASKNAAQQSVQPTLLTPRPETVVTKQNILAALEAIKKTQSG